MKEEDLFDLVVGILKKRGGKIKGIQPCETQGERIIVIDYRRQQARLSIIINHNSLVVRCSHTLTPFVQTFEDVFDDKISNNLKERMFDISLDAALDSIDATNEEILFTIN